VEDAVVLADVVSKHADLEAMLSEFMARRYERCKFIHDSSLQIGAWEQRPAPDADPTGLTNKMIQVMAQPV
jgi:hypothetical protein